MHYEKNKISDIISVLDTIKNEFQRHKNITELRKEAIKVVAERELKKNRYKNKNSAEKTIHDACVYRLNPDIKKTRDFDYFVSQWLNQNSMILKDILLGHAVGQLQKKEVNDFFD